MRLLCLTKLLLIVAFLIGCRSTETTQEATATATTTWVGPIPEEFQPKPAFGGNMEREPFEEYKAPPDFSHIDFIAVGLRNDEATKNSED